MRRLALLALIVLLAGCEVEDRPVAADAPATAIERPRPARPAARPDAAARRAARPDTARRPTPRAETPSPAARRAAALAAVEDLAVRAPDADAQGLARALALVDERADALARPPAALDTLRQSARAAARRGDRAAVALAAARAHRALTDGLDGPARLRSDALVLAALARQPLPDWTALRAAAADLAARWQRVEAQATDAGVHDALAAAVAGARRGADEQNAPLVRLAAEVAADLSVALGPAR